MQLKEFHGGTEEDRAKHGGRRARRCACGDRRAVEGTDEIKLAKDDPDAGGQERYIPLAWLVHTEIKIHLKLTGDEAKAQWSSFRSTTRRFTR